MPRPPSTAVRRPAAALLLVLCLLAQGCGALVRVEARGDVLPPVVPPRTSVLLDVDGGVLARLHAEQDRTPVPLAAIPRVLQDAVIAVEDARFRSHAGVDGRAVLRALAVNAAAGEVRQGGSTITQQLAKNLVTGAAPTLDRKVLEAATALRLEAELGKDGILERYLNTAYLGGGAYGVGAAARRWFGVEVGELDLARSALLAGMLAAPSRLDPLRHPEAARERRDLVLELVRAQGLAADAAVDAALATPVEVLDRPADDGWRHPWAVDHVLDRLHHDPAFRVLGETAADRAARIFGDGLVVETTVDPVTQRAAERAVAAVLHDPDDPRAAVVALDPRTGEVRAVVGGATYGAEGDPTSRFNLATDGRRQPGSAFKPLVLAAALEAGGQLDDRVAAPAALALPQPGGRTWAVRNAGGADWGEVDLRTATAWSINTAYAQLVRDVGADAVVEVARRAGVVADLDAVDAIALGAEEVTPLDLATATATLAADGVHRDPVAIRRILDADGVVLWQAAGAGVQALDPGVARDVALAMADVVEGGTGTAAAIGRPVAGKTGTSQDNADAWFTGFTPDLAVTVWVGFPEGRVPMTPPRTRVEVHGGGWPAEIFARTAVAALADVVATPLLDPDGDVVEVAVDGTRGCLPNPWTPPDVVVQRTYPAAEAPTQICAEPTGPAVVDVPVVLGMPVAQARGLLTGLGFAVVEVPVLDRSVPPGTVRAQDPAPGPSQRISAAGATAVLDVAAAEAPGDRVPDVAGLALAAARATLEQQGFDVRVDLICPPDGCADAVPAGVVWGQVPAAGSAAEPGAVVVLRALPDGG